MDDSPTVSFDGATVIEWDEEEPMYRLQHHWQGPAPISILVVEAVAAASDRAATELEPLYGIVDPELIDGLVVSSWRSDVTLSFPYEGYTVTVTSTGTVLMTDQEQTAN